MKSVIFLLLLCLFCLLPIIAIAATSNDSTSSTVLIKGQTTSEFIVEEIVAHHDKVFRMNNVYDEYVKEFKDLTIYVAPKLYIAIKIVIKDEKGTRTYFASDLGVNGSCDRMVKVPGSTDKSEDAFTHLFILGNADEGSIKTELNLVSVEREMGNKPYLNRLLLWKTEDGWRVADFEEGKIGNMPSYIPDKLWKEFINEVDSKLIDYSKILFGK